MLTSPEEANLFIIPLDDRRRWHRHHHLFAEFLRTELDEDKKIELHRRAAKWFKNNDHKNEAIEHALAGKDTGNAIRLIKGELNSLVVKGELYNLIHWLDELADEVICNDGESCSYKACTYFLIGQADKAIHYINSFHHIMEPDKLSRGRIRAWSHALTRGISLMNENRRLGVDIGDPAQMTFDELKKAVKVQLAYFIRHIAIAAHIAERLHYN